MMLRALSLFISFLLIFNSLVLELVPIFAPTKSEVLRHFKEHGSDQALEYACQFHNCGCTKETCKISCCCKTNHEVFDEMIKAKEAKCHEDSNCSNGSKKEIESKPTNIIQSMICKQVKLKEYDKLVLKRETYLLVKQKLTIKRLSDQTILFSEPFVYQGIVTQTYHIPESPPPIISL
jgi:hypothetical protein